MAARSPLVFILHGDDEFAISQQVTELKAELGDQAMVEMNTTALDGRSLSFETLTNAVRALPFLAQRRLVLLNHPLDFLQNPAARERLLALLENVPQTTALVLVEYRPLTSKEMKKKGQIHWLEKWASVHPERVFIKEFKIPKGAEMVDWIKERAKKNGGEFTDQAAALLNLLVGEEPRVVDQEVLKLLEFVDRKRPVEMDEVRRLTASIGEGDIFKFVDAIGTKDGKIAIDVYHQLLASDDPISIFGMVVRQFRLLLLVREILDGNGGEVEVIKNLNLHPFVAKKIIHQAKRYNLVNLESIYHRLLMIDVQTKLGEMDLETNLDINTVELTH